MFFEKNAFDAVHTKMTKILQIIFAAAKYVNTRYLKGAKAPGIPFKK